MEVKQKFLEGFIGDELMLLEIPLELEKFPNNVFRRIHATEFVYMGQMYDIVEQQQVGDATWYLVYPDRKETALKQKMKKRMDDYEAGSGFPKPEQLQLTLTLFLDAFPTFKLEDNWLFAAANWTFYQFSTKEWKREAPFHPPCSIDC